MNLDAYHGRFHGRAVRLSFPWYALREWTARYPLRLHFGPLPAMPDEPAPKPGDVLPTFGARKTPDGYLIDTSPAEPSAEAALWMLHLHVRPAYLLQGAHGHAAASGVPHVRVEEVEALGVVPILTTGTAEAFYGDALEEVRESLASVEPVLGDADLAKLEAVMYDLTGRLPATLDSIRRRKDRKMEAWAQKQTTAKLRKRSPLYIRFGGLPDGERSRDWMGGFEDGVSCFRARLEDGVYVADGARLSGQLALFKELQAEGREVYLASGEEIGLGGAYEPVLAGVELTPLPPGTRIRISDEWQEVVTLAYARDALRGLVYPPHVWRPPEEIVVPELAKLEREPARSVAEVLAAARGCLPLGCQGYELHGEEHWRRVAVAGARLADETPGADPLVILLFSLLHDAGRRRDFVDDYHAFRGAKLAQELLEGGPLLTEDQLETLTLAIRYHDTGETDTHPDIAVCWDSDRLDLWRVGVKPDPALLSTEAAPGMIEWAPSAAGRELRMG